MANDTIGSLTAVVSATAGQFDQDIKHIEGSVKGLQSTVESSSPHGGIFESIKEGLGIGAGIELAHQGIELLKQGVEEFFEGIEKVAHLDHFAESVGATANEINQLRFAASQFGIEGEQMDNALLKMEANLGKAREGSEKAGAVFNRLGINVDELAGMSGGDAFREIAQKISEIPDPADLSHDQEVAPELALLNEGAEGIDSLKKKAEELGIELSDSEVEAMAEAEKSVKALSFAWDAFKNEIIATVAPALTFLMDLLADVAAAAHYVATAVRQALGYDTNAQKPHEKRTAGASDAAGEAKAEAKEAEKAAKDSQKAIEETMKRGQQLTKDSRSAQEIYNDSVAEFLNLLNQGAISWEVYEHQVVKASDALDKATEKKIQQSHFDATQAVGSALQGTSAGFSAVQAAMRGELDAQKRQEELQKQQIEEEKKQTESLKRINDAIEAGSNHRPVTVDFV